MSDAAVLSRQRCFHHPGREAVCRCTGCTRTFCRECVVEHDGRLICATCLQTQTAAPSATSRVRTVRTLVFATAGFVASWVFFYMAGAFLVSLGLSWDDWRPQ
jgi:hypothetical protein